MKANATIVCGHTIGNYAMVGAGGCNVGCAGLCTGSRQPGETDRMGL